MNLNVLNEDECKLVQQFMESNKEIFQNSAVMSFFEEKLHLTWLVQTIKGNENSRELLDVAFKKHFFQMRFICYISSTIRFSTISLVRKMKKIKERNPLLIDIDDSDSNRKDELFFNYFPYQDEYFSEVKDFTQNIENEHLYSAWNELSPRQKRVILLSFVMSYQDFEIAQFLHISPQAVFSNKKRALIKLRTRCNGDRLTISG